LKSSAAAGKTPCVLNAGRRIPEGRTSLSGRLRRTRSEGSNHLHRSADSAMPLVR
jgi:hypothetical protein